MIPFNKPLVIGKELGYIKDAMKKQKLCGDGYYTHRCCVMIEEKMNCQKTLLTTSCTHSLEMCALLIDIMPGDEVIMPSFTFVSTANAFVLRGAKIIFVDIRPDTMNIDEKLIEAAITKKTKAIVVVHYAGVACEMDDIMKISKKYNLPVIEDAAQGFGSKYNGSFLGTIGVLGNFSFHETKNITCGEGGALLINNGIFNEYAEIIREKGTNRSKFWRGEVDKYTWVEAGSSYLPSELNAAFLTAQLEKMETINNNRLMSWKRYYDRLITLRDKGYLDLPVIPENCIQNGHMFYIKCRDEEMRDVLINFLKTHGINSVFHYIPLHSSPAGMKYGEFRGEDRWTTKESSRLIRLPMWYGLKKKDIDYIAGVISKFFEGHDKTND